MRVRISFVRPFMLTEQTTKELTKFIQEQVKRHSAVGITYPLKVSSFDSDVVALAFMSKKERR